MKTLANGRHGDRGLTLIESMISLAVLTIGMLGLMHLQVFGITSNQGGRARTQAAQLARELVAALERLDPLDPLLDPTQTAPEPAAGTMGPAGFGGLLGATSDSRPWSDTYLSGQMTGVTRDSSLERDPDNASAPVFARRWSVWQIQTANTTSAVRAIAVSVIYRERTMPQRREVVLYTQVTNPGAAVVNASAYR